MYNHLGFISGSTAGRVRTIWYPPWIPGILTNSRRNLFIYSILLFLNESEMISDKNISERSTLTGLLAITAAAILLTAGLSNNNISSNLTPVQGQEMQTNNNNNTIRVEAGGGN